MKLREKTNLEICDNNELPIAISTNVVEEVNAKNKKAQIKLMTPRTLNNSKKYIF